MGGETPFLPFLVVANAVVLVVILFLLIIYYKKYTNLMKSTNILPREREKVPDGAITQQTPPEAGGHQGKLVFVDEVEAEFELDDLFRASAEGLGKGNFGNCYKAMLETGEAIVVKRMIDLKPLSSVEFVRQVRALAEQKHPNLLPLLAYYYTRNEEKLFLYRFAPNGNLFNRLHGIISRSLVLYTVDAFCFGKYKTLTYRETGLAQT